MRRHFLTALVACALGALGGCTATAEPWSMRVSMPSGQRWMGTPPKPRDFMGKIIHGPSVRPDQLVRLDRCPGACTLELDDLATLHATITIPF